MGEEDVTMKQDITATSGASSSSASRGPAMDTESRRSRKRSADVQTEDLEDNEQLDANENAASLPQAEGESTDGKNVHWQLGTAAFGRKLLEMETWVSTKVWTLRQ